MRELNTLRRQIATLRATTAAAEPTLVPTDPWGKPIADTREGRRQALIDGLAGPKAPCCAEEFGADDSRARREHLEALSYTELLRLWSEVARNHFQRTMSEEDRKQQDYFCSLPLNEKVRVLREMAHYPGKR